MSKTKIEIRKRKREQNRCGFTAKKLENAINKWNELISMTDHWARHIESVAQNLHKIMIRFCSTEYISSFHFARIRSPFPYRTSLTVEWILRSDIGINFNNNFIIPMWCSIHLTGKNDSINARIRYCDWICMIEFDLKKSILKKNINVEQISHGRITFSWLTDWLTGISHY